MDSRAWSKPEQVVAKGACVSECTRKKVNVGQLATVAGCVRVCVCHHLGPVFVLFLRCCCATSACSNTSSPTGFTLGTCNLSNKALFVCVLTRKRAREEEGGNNLPYKGFTDAFLLENEASGKSYKSYIFSHRCNRAVCLWFV